MSAFNIAQQLSVGAREALLAFPSIGMRYCHERKDIPYLATLARLGLAKKRWSGTTDNPWEITPLGAEVQALVKVNSSQTMLEPNKCPWGCKPVIKERTIPASDPRFPDRTSFEIICKHAHLIGDPVLVPGQKEHDELVSRWNTRDGDVPAVPEATPAQPEATPMRILLPPASNITGDYSSGWCEGQAYLIDNYGSDADGETAIATAALFDLAARSHIAHLRDNLPIAIAKALYGPQFNPHIHPESFDFCETATETALDGLPAVSRTRLQDLKTAAHAICLALGDDPEREGPWDSWWMHSKYAEAALAVQSVERAEIERLRGVLRCYATDEECSMCETLVASGALARVTLGEEA